MKTRMSIGIIFAMIAAQMVLSLAPSVSPTLSPSLSGCGFPSPPQTFLLHNWGYLQCLGFKDPDAALLVNCAVGSPTLLTVAVGYSSGQEYCRLQLARIQGMTLIQPNAGGNLANFTSDNSSGYMDYYEKWTYHPTSGEIYGYAPPSYNVGCLSASSASGPVTFVTCNSSRVAQNWTVEIITSSPSTSPTTSSPTSVAPTTTLAPSTTSGPTARPTTTWSPSTTLSPHTTFMPVTSAQPTTWRPVTSSPISVAPMASTSSPPISSTPTPPTTWSPSTTFSPTPPLAPASSTGAIVGGVVGGLLAIAFSGLALRYRWIRQGKAEQNGKLLPFANPTPPSRPVNELAEKLKSFGMSEVEAQSAAKTLYANGIVSVNVLRQARPDHLKEAGLNVGQVMVITKGLNPRASTMVAADDASDTYSDVFVSFRIKDSLPLAEGLKDKLAGEGIVAFVCAVPVGESLVGQITRHLLHCKMAIILGSETYGAKTTSSFGTSEELETIMDHRIPFFLIKTCAEFTSDLAKFHLRPSILYYKMEINPAYPDRIPGDLLQAILDKYKSVLAQNRNV